jgi:hypothetical protein
LRSIDHEKGISMIRNHPHRYTITHDHHGYMIWSERIGGTLPDTDFKPISVAALKAVGIGEIEVGEEIDILALPGRKIWEYRETSRIAETKRENRS